MTNTQANQPFQPLSSQFIIRILLVLCVILSIMAGYYHAILKQEQKKYARIEDFYVRVRSQLGREETQRLIDLSRYSEMNVQVEEYVQETELAE